MLTCKQVSKALSKGDYEDLPPIRKFFLKLHVKLCIFCGKFNHQVMETQNMCRHYRTKEETHEIDGIRPKLDSARREHLQALLSSHRPNDSGDSMK